MELSTGCEYSDSKGCASKFVRINRGWRFKCRLHRDKRDDDGFNIGFVIYLMKKEF
jgi:hypothetical protein